MTSALISRRRPRQLAEPPPTPRRSDWLVKKALRRAPSVAAAQNVLMRKLGLVSSDHVESADFDCYLSSFNEGLSENQALLIQELLGTRALLIAEVPLEETC
jgi:hypothetical protein